MKFLLLPFKPNFGKREIAWCYVIVDDNLISVPVGN